MRPPIPARESKVLSVAGLTRLVGEAIDSKPGLKGVEVEGEISRWKPYPSGHIYFTLKDAEAVIDCVFFQGAARHGAAAQKDGDKVVASGDVRVFAQRGKYQFYVSSLKAAGAGALWAAFERLKRRLSEEGITEAARKRPLPRLPRRVGLVTSPESAAIRDMLTVLGRRFPLAEVVCEDVPVQGREAAPAIAEGIRRMAAAAARLGIDVVIVGRGGGSIEDLWAFNEEIVARAIDAARPFVPIVSAVGHETDWTIADLVADVRAPTPSAAAEIVVPDRADLLAGLAGLAGRLGAAADRRLAAASADLAALRGALRSPRERLDLRRERLDRLWGGLAAAAASVRDGRRAALETRRRRLAASSPAARLARVRAAVDLAGRRAAWAEARRRERLAARVEALSGRLGAVSPLAVLGRGYAVVFGPDGRACRRPADAPPGAEVRARLAEGEIRARVIGSGR